MSNDREIASHAGPDKEPTVTDPAAAPIVEWLSWAHRREEDERKKDRFWRNVRTALIALGIGMGPIYLWIFDSRANPYKVGDEYAAVVRIDGVIAAEKAASAERISNSLEAAFRDTKAKGVVVVINSPGGSPVQSSIIRDRILSLRAEFPQTKVWAVGEDMLTSGGYFIAMGAANVCVNRSSVTGSIGVVQDGWGFDKVIERFGIERRVFTAGQSKSRLDSFRPLNPDDEKKVHQLLEAVHEHFKDVVREGRGTRLKAAEAELFTGDFWTGEEALRLGLVDRLCDLNEILIDEYGVRDAKNFTRPPTLLAALSSSIGTSVAEGVARMLQSEPAALLPR
jgi:protease IV